MREYNADSIKHLSFRDAVRLRVGMYLGSSDNVGAFNGFLEIINNSTDEALAGYGRLIEVFLSPSALTYEVRDNGRGIPRGPSKDSEEILVTLMTTSHSGGKFDKEVYTGFSRGQNGVGSGATCMSADWMEIATKRDGYEWTLKFTEGVPTTSTAVQGKPTKTTGTTFKWKPSQQVFAAEPLTIDVPLICETLEEYSYFNKGTTFRITNLDTEEVFTYLSENGIRDFVEEVIRDPFIKNTLFCEVKEDGVELECYANWTRGREEFYLFVNGAPCPDGGQPITGAKTAITRTVNSLSKEKFSGELIRKGLVYIISIKHPNPMFSNQTKTSIGNPELRKMCDSAFSQMIRGFQEKSPSEFETLVKSFHKMEKAEKAAEDAKLAILDGTKKIEKTIRRKVFATDKLKDSTKLGADSMLLLAEGNSAMAALLSARDYERFGVLALRGKMINVLANQEEKVYSNEEVLLILSALGVSPANYSAKKLRYGKVGICVDGDVDGYHVALLIMSFFRKLLPKFLEEERLYWLQAPLFKVTSRGQSYFYYDEKELKNGVKGEQVRYKGLGQMNPEDMKLSMFGPKRKLEQIKVSPAGLQQLDELMGKDGQYRKDFLFSEIDFSEYGSV